jgi:hypothetical protein
MPNMLDGVDAAVAELVSDIQAGGLEPDGIALAFGTQVSNDPTALGWGTDLSCGFIGDGSGVIDCDDHMSEVDPNSTAAVAQHAERFFSTPQGGILNDTELLVAVGEDPDWGYNLIQLLSQGLDATTIQAHCELGADAFKRHDDRVATCKITPVTGTDPVTNTTVMRLFLSGELVTGQSYSLVLPLTPDNIPAAEALQ